MNGCEKLFDLSTCEVGKSYWVINGNWEFKVLSVNECSITVRIPSDPFKRKSFDIPFSSLMVLRPI